MTEHASYNSYIWEVRVAKNVSRRGSLKVNIQVAAHLVEIRHLSNVYKIDDGEISNLLCNAVQRLVHFHACVIVVVAEANHYDAVFFRKDGLVDVPSGWQVREEVGHGEARQGVRGEKLDALMRLLLALGCSRRGVGLGVFGSEASRREKMRFVVQFSWVAMFAGSPDVVG